MVPAQILQVSLGGGQVAAGEGGAGVGVEVLAGVQRRQPQQPSLAGGEVLVGQVEGKLDAGVQPPLVVAFVEPVGVVGQSPAGRAANVCGDEAEGQGQVTAAAGDPGRRVRV
jgi:hypothetical protein